MAVFIVLTFDRDIPPCGAWQQLRRWILHLERVAQEGVIWFASMEDTTLDRPHFHVLLATASGSVSLTARSIGRKWQPGLAKVEAFRRGLRGGTYYIVMQLGPEEETIDGSPRWDISQRWFEEAATV